MIAFASSFRAIATMTSLRALFEMFGDGRDRWIAAGGNECSLEHNMPQRPSLACNHSPASHSDDELQTDDGSAQVVDHYMGNHVLTFGTRNIVGRGKAVALDIGRTEPGHAGSEAIDDEA